jgi:hypothetical protein
MLGQELDQKIRIWSRKRKQIHTWTRVEQIRLVQAQAQKKLEEDEKNRKEEDEEDFRELLKVDVHQGEFRIFLRRAFGKIAALFLRRYVSIIRREERDRIEDVKFDALYEVTKRIESSLIDISTRLDDIGTKCVGGLHFRLYRSSLYVNEFGMLLKTLRVGNVPTWVGYDRFVERGLQPTFEYIAEVGVRLRALRDRLQSVMDAIETSALVVQSEATRHNTAVLRHIVNVGILTVIVAGIWVLTWTIKAYNWSWEWLKSHLLWISSHMPDISLFSSLLDRIRHMIGL